PLTRPVNDRQDTDAQHYGIAEPDGAHTFYGLLALAEGQTNRLLAFTSCRRFSGKFYLRDSSLQVVVDTEGLVLKPGAHWELEEFLFDSGVDRQRLFDGLAQRLALNHPPLRVAAPPTGWCSWYCFGPRVTAQQVLANLDFIAKHT